MWNALSKDEELKNVSSRLQAMKNQVEKLKVVMIIMFIKEKMTRMHKKK